MKIIIFHGYLLRGTGSNIYNNNLARALAGLGHEVHLFCQDLEAEELPWVDSIGLWQASGPGEAGTAENGAVAGRLEVRQLRESDATGSVTVYRPPIGRILPVYVEDPYEGFEARAYPRLSELEVEDYIAVNVKAVREVEKLIGGSDAALANHLLMAPVVLARAGVRPYAVKHHGSDLEYTVKPNPRFVPYAEEGLGPAAAILVGSWFTAASLWEAIPGLELESKTGLGPPGVDTSEFSPLPASAAAGRIEELAAAIRSGPPSTSFGRDEEGAVAALEEMGAAEGPRVIFVGKLIVSKGVDLLVAAWPLIHRENPGARLLLVGFGAYEMGLRALATTLGEGDLDSARHIAAVGRELEGGPTGRLDFLAEFLAIPPMGYAAAAIEAAASISFSGRLEHDEVARVIPACEAIVVPSTFPEAFGMVAAEGAASGVMPVCAGHSGLAEVTAVLAKEVPAVSELISFELGPDAVAQLGARVNGWLATGEAERVDIGRNIAESADRNWSWRGVAKDVISASGGHIQPVREP
jgi:glycosyltransferase involved in cell wall biosynthesis